MTEACIVGWAHTPFRRLEDPDIESPIGPVPGAALQLAPYRLLPALPLPRAQLDPFLDATLTQQERVAVHELLSRRIDERIPAAYLTREAWLGAFRFYVDERVIVPRSFIAELLPDGRATFVGERADARTAPDLCPGSGCPAILLAPARPNAGNAPARSPSPSPSSPHVNSSNGQNAGPPRSAYPRAL